MKTLRVMAVLGIALLATSCHAAPAPAGTSVTLPVTFSSGTQAVTAVQFDLVLPVGVSSQSVVAGAASTTAQKTIATNMVNGNLRVLISGTNQTPISDGQIALVTLQLASNLPTTTFQLNLINVSASSPAGTNVPLGQTVPGVLSVLANVIPFLSVGSN